MLSRVAESIYWLNRYIERAENVARFIDVNVNLSVEENDSAGQQFSMWQPLISTTGDDEDFNARYDATASRENVLRFLLFDEHNGNSIFSCIMRARENARAIRQVIPTVVWEQLNKFYIFMRAAARACDLNSAQDFCEAVRLSSHTLAGAADATMSSDEAWHFARLGRMLERADKTSRIVDVQYFNLLPKTDDIGSTLDVMRWSALLRSTSALAMYRRQCGNISPRQVAEFLILDRFFPRAMHHCVCMARESLTSITGCPPGTFTIISERRLGILNATMDYASIDEIIANGMHEYIDGFQRQLNTVGESIAQDFFTWATPDATAQASTAGPSQFQQQLAD